MLLNKPDREEARLDALHQLNLLDTPPSESFDRITRMASQIFGLPISAVSLTDRDRQWFKSRVGVEHCSVPRHKAPCAQVAESADTVIIPDLLADDYYRTSILAGQGIRFYAGAPLVTREGYGLGALCVLGTEPRTASPTEMAALNDLAKMAMAQIELQHAFGRIDPISGLSNRVQFLDDLADLARDSPGERRLAVLVDLARPEQLNSGVRVLGAGFADEMVQAAARAIRGALRPQRTAYHVAATQFAFLAPSMIDEQSYVAALGPELEALRGQWGARFVTTAAIGVAPFIVGETAPLDVLRTAYSAAQDARGLEKTQVSVYSLANDDEHRRSFELLNDFGSALQQPGQLRLVFQPRIELSTGACVGAEALLRWQHPAFGNVSPVEFIPIIEQTAYARSATSWVLEAALAQVCAWRRAGLHFPLSINVSAANLEETDFAERVRLHLLKHGVPAEALEIEVTESAIMADERHALVQLSTLRATGVRLAIDDFGTGYSSLAYLQRLPAQVVKIDKSFITDMADDERQQSLVRSMITLSHQLGYRVVAEGVETAPVADMLVEMMCDEAQGYFFARPLETDDFNDWLAVRAANSAVSHVA